LKIDAATLQQIGRQRQQVIRLVTESLPGRHATVENFIARTRCGAEKIPSIRFEIELHAHLPHYSRLRIYR
jgi:glycine cleavage system regulatory protein